jgi:hypothetical protein
MVKKTKKVSVTKGLITTLEGRYVIKELDKDGNEIGEIFFDELIEDFRDIEGVSISISHDKVI